MVVGKWERDKLIWIRAGVIVFAGVVMVIKYRLKNSHIESEEQISDRTR